MEKWLKKWKEKKWPQWFDAFKKASANHIPGMWITALLFLVVSFFVGKTVGEQTSEKRQSRQTLAGDNSFGHEIPKENLSGEIMSGGYNAANALQSAENWGLGFGKDGTAPTGTATAEELAKYDAYYIADTKEKIIYLTFDCGYENGNTEAILDALKKHNAPATFFVVGHYLESAPALVKRMVQDGHSVGNHTYHHPDMTSISDKATFQKEMDDVQTLFKEITGVELAMYYRPPQGKYSLDNLRQAKELGYSTYFWSLAYVDWNVDAQPSHEEALGKLTRRVHPGAIVLLHTTSKTNGEIMDELLTKWEEMGYTFGGLEELRQEELKK